MIALSAIVNVPLLTLTVGPPLLQRVNIVFACLAVFVGVIAALLSLLIVGPLLLVFLGPGFSSLALQFPDCRPRIR